MGSDHIYQISDLSFGFMVAYLWKVLLEGHIRISKFGRLVGASSFALYHLPSLWSSRSDRLTLALFGIWTVNGEV